MSDPIEYVRKYRAEQAREARAADDQFEQDLDDVELDEPVERIIEYTPPLVGQGIDVARGHDPNPAKFTSREREFMLAEVGRQYLRGEKIGVIAKNIGVSLSTVHNMTKELGQRWRISADIDFSTKRAEELEKLNNLERTFWEAWELSCKETTKTTLDVDMTKGAATPKRQRVVRTQSTGNPAYLDGVFRCIDRRIKLLGIDAAERYALEARGTAGGGNDLEARLEKYSGVLAFGIVGVASADSPNDGVGEPVDSERPASEAGGILDADYKLR